VQKIIQVMIGYGFMFQEVENILGIRRSWDFGVCVERMLPQNFTYFKKNLKSIFELNFSKKIFIEKFKIAITSAQTPQHYSIPPLPSSTAHKNRIELDFPKPLIL
jgi:hypothetical protein